MIIIGWRADRTVQFLFDSIRKKSRLPELILLDDLLNESPSVRSTIWLKLQIENIKKLRSFGGVYVRWLIPSDILKSDMGNSFLAGLEFLNNFPAGMICNRPNSIPTNFSKGIHLLRYLDALKKAGVLVPPTLVTNSPSAIDQFVGENNHCIIKGASSKKSICTDYTLEHHKYTSGKFVALLQKKIFGPDIRVHITKSGYIAEGFISKECDYRFSRNKICFQVAIPRRIKKLCDYILEIEKINFAGVDFKIDSQGQWWFLEANSSPAFQGFDIRSKGAIVDLLLDWSDDLTKFSDWPDFCTAEN